jgi:hypothetical protein
VRAADQVERPTYWRACLIETGGDAAVAREQLAALHNPYDYQSSAQLEVMPEGGLA